MRNKIYPILVWAVVAAVYAPIFQLLYSKRWEFIDYTHAYFILPVSLFLVWHKKDSLKKIPLSETPGSFAAGFVLTALASLMLAFGWKQDYQLIATLSLIPMLFGVVYCLYGLRFVKALSFPILYLLLLVPPPVGVLDSVTLPMRYGVSVAAEHILKFLHYPISREGLLLSIGGHKVFLGEACSGFRSLVTLASLGLAYIYISKNSRRGQWILGASIVPLAILGNLARVTSVVLATHYLGITESQKIFHDVSGFIMFAVMILGLMGLESLLSKKTSEISKTP